GWCTSPRWATGPRRPSPNWESACSSPPCATRSPRAMWTSPCTPTKTSPPHPILGSRWPTTRRCETAAPPRVLAAPPPREDPRDALVARDGLVLGELPAGSRVGTGSARRKAQLEALGLGLDVVPIRGNVDTRVRKVATGELDAVVVAAAGLRRLGRITEATELLDPVQMLPAPAQGALAIECRANDHG